MNTPAKRPPTPAERDWNGPACEPDDDEGDPGFNAVAVIVAFAVVLIAAYHVAPHLFDLAGRLWRWLA